MGQRTSSNHSVVSSWLVKRAPFLPVPPADYLEFRLVTQYGGGHGEPRGEIRAVDVVDYLQWCKEQQS